jgi:hypothetical protein
MHHNVIDGRTMAGMIRHLFGRTAMSAAPKSIHNAGIEEM